MKSQLEGDQSLPTLLESNSVTGPEIHLPADSERGKEVAGSRPLIRIIVNPAAGQDQAFLKTFNTIFGDADWDWDMLVTKGPGDGVRFARQAVADGVTIVGAFGGDGTVMEVACGLSGTETPLAILPGGTGNVVSIDLGIPRDLVAACEAVIDPRRQIQMLDLGETGERCFVLRLGIGLEADVIQGADREAKDQYGIFAYIMSIIKSLREPETARYQLTIDGEEHECEGIACLIANVGNLGIPGLTIAPGVDPCDGVMDVFVIQRADLGSLVSMAASVFSKTENQTAVQHWQAREQVGVVSDPPQLVQGDGEIFGNSPVSVKIVPGAVQVIVPYSS